MGALSKILRSVDGGRVSFWCPGCDECHTIVVDGDRAWGWNRDVDRPTFTPSILVQYPHMSEEGNRRNREFYEQHGRYMTREELPYDRMSVCHSFVESGRIRFLDDCTHELKGQTVDLPEWPRSLVG